MDTKRLNLKQLALMELYYDVQSDLQGLCLEDVAYASGCSPSTLYNWREGNTIAPRINTLTRVAQVLGYEITWTKN